LKQEERTRQTIGRLLAAAKELIPEKGCASITMKDIMERSGLSKGAIFHHVKTKDEIFAWLLLERLEETDRRFAEETEREEKTFEGPLARIAENFASLADGKDATNQVLIYLLGKEGDPAVRDALGRFYEQSVRYSSQWIESGRKHGVIPASVDAAKAGEAFVLVSLGLRVRASIPDASRAFSAGDFAQFIRETLQPKRS